MEHAGRFADAALGAVLVVGGGVGGVAVAGRCFSVEATGSRSCGTHNGEVAAGGGVGGVVKRVDELVVVDCRPVRHGMSVGRRCGSLVDGIGASVRSWKVSCSDFGAGFAIDGDLDPGSCRLRCFRAQGNKTPILPATVGEERSGSVSRGEDEVDGGEDVLEGHVCGRARGLVAGVDADDCAGAVVIGGRRGGWRCVGGFIQRNTEEQKVSSLPFNGCRNWHGSGDTSRDDASMLPSIKEGFVGKVGFAEDSGKGRNR